MRVRSKRHVSPERACRSVSEWPERDRAKWQSAVEPQDVFDDATAISELREISRRKLEKGFGRFLTFHDRKQKGTWPPATDAEVHRTIVAYVDELKALDNAPFTILARLQELKCVMRFLYPEHDWRFISRISSRLRRDAQPRRPKAELLVNSAMLLDLGLRLIADARQIKNRSRSAQLHRDGLVLALLALRPLRRRNLIALELKRTLLGSGDDWRIAFSGAEMKNARPWSATWPTILVAPLEEWLSVHRPYLAGRRVRAAGNMLWLTSRGTWLAGDTLYALIRKHTIEAFGTSVSPHLFRGIAATTQAISDPKSVRIAAPLLAHSSFQTTERHYLHARDAEAVGRFQTVLTNRRRSRFVKDGVL